MLRASIDELHLSGRLIMHFGHSWFGRVLSSYEQVAILFDSLCCCQDRWSDRLCGNFSQYLWATLGNGNKRFCGSTWLSTALLPFLKGA